MVAVCYRVKKNLPYNQERKGAKLNYRIAL